MWMGSKKGTYRAEGAFGQITVVDPETDLIISFTEANHSFDPASQESMNRVWKFIEKVDPTCKELLKDKTLSDQVKKEFSSLAIAQPPYQPFGIFKYEDVTYTSEVGAHPENLFYLQVKSNPATSYITGITKFSFKQVESRLINMHATINGTEMDIQVPIDGSRRLHTIDAFYKSLVYVSGYWKDEDSFAVRFRWIETVFEKELSFHFEENQCIVTEHLTSDQQSKPISITFQN